MPAAQKRLRRQRRPWHRAQFSDRSSRARDRDPLATRRAIDDIAAVIAQVANADVCHACIVSRVIQARRGISFHVRSPRGSGGGSRRTMGGRAGSAPWMRISPRKRQRALWSGLAALGYNTPRQPSRCSCSPTAWNGSHVARPGLGMSETERICPMRPMPPPGAGNRESVDIQSHLLLL